MSNNLMEDLIEFLKAANLSTYEINAYIALLKSHDLLTAREISSKSKVPSGRIYEILDELHNKGMIEIQDSRPKKFRAVALNRAFYNLISHQTSEDKRKTKYLFQQAKILESNLYKSDLFVKKEPSKIFWETVYETQSILNLYYKYCSESQEEILMNDFLNKNTIKILPYANDIFLPIVNALNRGVRVKILWSFEYDNRSLSEDDKSKNSAIFDKVKIKLKELFGLSTELHGFKMKFIYKKIPTYYDIFDKKRVIFKLQNPLNPWQIFACMNVLDPNLAEKLREKFLNIWLFEAIGNGLQKV